MVIDREKKLGKQVSLATGKCASYIRKSSGMKYQRTIIMVSVTFEPHAGNLYASPCHGRVFRPLFPKDQPVKRFF
jgi:hypothetical protein